MNAAAIDSSVLITIFKGEADKLLWLDLLIRLQNQGVKLIVCSVVWAEIASLYSNEAALILDLNDLGITFDPLQPPASFLAGQIFSHYRRLGGPRKRLIPDFLIGAHALKQSIGILASDSGYLRAHFQGLLVIEPDKA